MATQQPVGIPQNSNSLVKYATPVLVPSINPPQFSEYFAIGQHIGQKTQRFEEKRR